MKLSIGLASSLIWNAQRMYANLNQLCRNTLDDPPNNLYLAHYCGVNAAESILANNELWLFDLSSSNDSLEFEIGVDSLARVFSEELFDRVEIGENISTFFEGDYELAISHILKARRHAALGLEQLVRTVPYGICFVSGEIESIPHWSMYGDGGEGVCLLFSVPDFAVFFDQVGAIGSSVAYDEESFKNLLISLYMSYSDLEINGSRSAVHRRLSTFRENVGLAGGEKIDEALKKEALSIAVSVLVSLRKHSDFRFENEFRLLVPYTGQDDYKLNDFGTRSYISTQQFSTSSLPVAEIILGPTASSKNSYQSLVELAKQKNIKIRFSEMSLTQRGDKRDRRKFDDIVRLAKYLAQRPIDSEAQEEAVASFEAMAVSRKEKLKELLNFFSKDDNFYHLLHVLNSDPLSIDRVFEKIFRR